MSAVELRGLATRSGRFTAAGKATVEVAVIGMIRKVARADEGETR